MRPGEASTIDVMYSASIHLNASLDTVKLPTYLADRLLHFRAAGVGIHDDRVTFTSGPNFWWNWEASVDAGEVVVDRKLRQIRYFLSFRRAIVIATKRCVFVALLAILVIAPVTQSLSPLLFVPLLWVLSIGGNYLFGIVAFHRFLRRSLAEAPHFN